MDVLKESEIAHFFNGRSVFITGATGFMGKVLVEKLLRSCPGVKTLYLLMRNKKGLAPKQRMDQLLNDKVFGRIKEENNNFSNKIVVVEGDITVDGLGMSQNDLNSIIENVSVIFHSAATVKFEEPLRVAINYNILGTQRVIELAHKVHNLAALVHVSTAYANCDRNRIDEVIYEQKITPQQLMDAATWMSDDMIEKLLPDLLGNRPNTYTYTKAMAETLIMESCGQLPVAIVRPSIVTAAWKDPYPGWVDNINNVTGVFLATCKGVLRTAFLESTAVLDIVPVDIVINLLIAVAWNTATKQHKDILIYNCTTGLVNPITISDVQKWTFPLALKYPCSEHFRYPELTLRRNRFVHSIFVALDHYLPAYVYDWISAMTGGKRRMVSIYEKLHKATDQLVFFATRQWQFKSINLPELHDQLQGVDQETFCFDVRKIDWPTYLKDYYMGIRTFILKEDISTIPSARRKLRRLFLTNKLVEFVIYLGLAKLILYKTDLSTTLSTLLGGQTNSTIAILTRAK
ncbi:putative fatty acyl-CoA reductase CG5065 [Brevipalpus obovatus]|uniref:putative fatty acyl-CoA reductase CG5065 n=1 Tax=Brevipalpus obovatus TaxID=246614 RepID=UPI003D9EFC48